MIFCEDEREFALQALIAMSCNPLFARPNLLVYVIYLFWMLTFINTYFIKYTVLFVSYFY